VRAHKIHHAVHISIFYFSYLLHVGGGQGTLPVLVKNVMDIQALSPHEILHGIDAGIAKWVLLILHVEEKHAWCDSISILTGYWDGSVQEHVIFNIK
jgi:hypothetical protein